MAKDDEHTYTPDDMRSWLQRETSQVLKEAELRVKDATDFVMKFTASKISEKQLSERMSQYEKRWREARLIAAMPSENLTNEQILRNLDKDLAEPEQKPWVQRDTFRRERGRQ